MALAWFASTETSLHLAFHWYKTDVGNLRLFSRLWNNGRKWGYSWITRQYQPRILIFWLLDQSPRHVLVIGLRGHCPKPAATGHAAFPWHPLLSNLGPDAVPCPAWPTLAGLRTFSILWLYLFSLNVPFHLVLMKIVFNIFFNNIYQPGTEA